MVDLASLERKCTCKGTEGSNPSLSSKFFTYILKSEKDNSFYYGSTENIEKRLKEHNSGKVKYTKAHRPWKIHYFEQFDVRSDAGKRELFFKSIDGYNWLKQNNIT